MGRIIKIEYFLKTYQFINSFENYDCDKVLLRVYPKIDIEKIYNIIDDISEISDIRKEYLKVILKERYDKILTPAYNKLI